MFQSRWLIPGFTLVLLFSAQSFASNWIEVGSDWQGNKIVIDRESVAPTLGGIGVWFRSPNGFMNHIVVRCFQRDYYQYENNSVYVGPMPIPPDSQPDVVRQYLCNDADAVAMANQVYVDQTVIYSPNANPIPSNGGYVFNNGAIKSYQENPLNPEYFKSYVSGLQHRILDKWNPPPSYLKTAGKLVFFIDKNGRLLSIKTTAPFESKEAEEAARQAIKNAAPFPPLPSQYPRNTVDVEMTFDYSVFGE